MVEAPLGGGQNFTKSQIAAQLCDLAMAGKIQPADVVKFEADSILSTEAQAALRTAGIATNSAN